MGQHFLNWKVANFLLKKRENERFCPLAQTVVIHFFRYFPPLSDPLVEYALRGPVQSEVKQLNATLRTTR